jgi:transcriptional regulator with XRE-family HTH domain
MADKKEYTIRIKEAISAIKIRYNISTQKEIVTTLGYSASSYLSDLMSGKFQLTDRFLNALADKYNVNPSYIKFGKGGLWLDNYSSGGILVGDHLQIGNKNVMNDTEYIQKLTEENAECRKFYEAKIEEFKSAIQQNIKMQERLLSEIAEQRKVTERSQAQIQDLICIVRNLTKPKE